MKSNRPSARPHPKKLRDSKWTAVGPEDGEKHFVVTRVLDATTAASQAPSVELRCLVTKRTRIVAQADLLDPEHWRPDWL